LLFVQRVGDAFDAIGHVYERGRRRGEDCMLSFHWRQSGPHVPAPRAQSESHIGARERDRYG
jgi:hypothetical protein